MVEPRVAPVTGPRIDGDAVEFALEDAERRLRGVRLQLERGVPGDDLDFRFDEAAGRWALRLPRPPVHRLEYKLLIRHGDGGTESITDPANHRRAPGAFGEKSVLEMPGYAAPGWLCDPDTPRWDLTAELPLSSGAGQIDVAVLSPPEPTPRLVLAHDGPEYDHLAHLGRFAAAAVRASRVPPFHLALAAPGARDARYSANPMYSAALAARVIPALHDKLGTGGPIVLMGASLGALAALHAQRRHPKGIGGLFLQSGSFFIPEHDDVESGFRYYRRIVRYVASVHRTHRFSSPVPAVLTCGATEENVHNNRAMAGALRRQGYPTRLYEVLDVHNYTAWRDAFDPPLVELLNAVWPEAAKGDEATGDGARGDRARGDRARGDRESAGA